MSINPLASVRNYRSETSGSIDRFFACPHFLIVFTLLRLSGLIVSVIIVQAISLPDGTGNNTYSLFNGYAHVSCSYYKFLVLITVTKALSKTDSAKLD